MGTSKRICIALLVAVVASSVLAGCLKADGANSGRLVGSWVDVDHGMPDARYRNIMQNEFSLQEVWNSWIQTEPCNDCWSLGPMAGTVAQVQQWGEAIRSTALVWGHDTKGDAVRGNFTPDYVGSLTTSQLHAELNSHIHTMVTSFPKIRFWNVVNEPFTAPDANGVVSQRGNVFKNKLGTGWIKEALVDAYNANPSAMFTAINEFNADGMNAKSDAMYHYYKNNLIGAIPSDHLSVGFQMHLSTCSDGLLNPSAAGILQNMQRFAALGITVYVTEMDFSIRCLTGTWDHKMQVQRDKFHDVTADCMAVPNCRGISFWGVGDADSWIRTWVGHYDWPDLYDDNYNPKPAYYGVEDALNGR